MNANESLYEIFDKPSILTADERKRLTDLWNREGTLTADETREMKSLEKRMS